MDREQHFRKKIMLFTCWRNAASYKEQYNKLKCEIDKNSISYETNSSLLEILENECIDDQDSFAQVAASNEHNEERDRSDDCDISTKYGCFNPGDKPLDYDVGLDLGIARKQIGQDDSLIGKMPDIEYKKREGVSVSYIALV